MRILPALAAALLLLAAGPASADGGVPACQRLPGTQAQIIEVPAGGCTGSGIVPRVIVEEEATPAAARPVIVVVAGGGSGGTLGATATATAIADAGSRHRDRRPTISHGYVPGMAESGVAFGGPPHRHRHHHD